MFPPTSNSDKLYKNIMHDQTLILNSNRKLNFSGLITFKVTLHNFHPQVCTGINNHVSLSLLHVNGWRKT